MVKLALLASLLDAILVFLVIIENKCTCRSYFSNSITSVSHGISVHILSSALEHKVETFQPSDRIEVVFRARKVLDPSPLSSIGQASSIDAPSTSSGPPPTTDEFSQFKAQTEYQILILQRLIQEMRNSSRVMKEQLGESAKVYDSIKEKSKSVETRIAQLQKVVAMQTENYAKLRREVNEKDNETKDGLERVIREVTELKFTVDSLTNTVSELKRNCETCGSTSALVAENVTQMFEALERQLGMHDVRMAAMDLRFQVLETCNYNGSLVWRIRDFERGRASSVLSQPMYASRSGCKMCARTYLNGDGTGPFLVLPGGQVRIQNPPPRHNPSQSNSSSPGEPPTQWQMADVISASHRRFLSSLFLNRELDRLASFARWPADRPNVSPTSLAKTGFFYLGDMDRTQCFSCGGVLRNWTSNDNALAQHRAHFPQCKMVLGTENCNAPVPSCPESTEERERRFPCSYPSNCHMVCEEARLDTFDQRWPTDRISAIAAEIAQAGFFFVGEGDRVKCWYCNGGLQNWEYDDIPWIEHAKWFPNCQFLLRVKGQYYVHRQLSANAHLPRPIIAKQNGASIDPPISGYGQPSTSARFQDAPPSLPGVARASIFSSSGTVPTSGNCRVSYFDDDDGDEMMDMYQSSSGTATEVQGSG